MGNAKKALNLIETNLYDKNESGFFRSIVELIQCAKRNMEKQVNSTMVVTYFEIGRRIIEKEQQGKKRAQYGKKVLQGLSDYLTKHLGKGWSTDNLKLMRRFYVVYSATTPIGEPLVHQLNTQIS